MRSIGYLPAMLVPLAAAACGSGVGTTPPDGSAISCANRPLVGPEVGVGRIVDAVREGNCIDLESGSSEREYLVVAYSGTARESSSGTSGGFTLAFGPEEVPAVAVPAASAARLTGDGAGARELHDNLRRLEREAIAAGHAEGAPASSIRRPPPVVGQADQFRVCRNTSCSGVNTISTTVRYVGPRGAIHLDNDMPAGADVLTQTDIDHLGNLFDQYLYPLDTTAFGVESDLDGDGHIAIVITPAVNALTTDCTAGRTVGYFFGGDLLFSYPGSNQREVFFAFAPKPAAGNCPAVTRNVALRSLGPVLIHELQHMIAFNQRVLKAGRNDHPVWLSEALSHIAEELGQRFVPDAFCPHSSSCYSEYGGGNIYNGRDYLVDVAATPLLAPENDGVTLAGRGAGWLFLRWLVDHHAADPETGSPLLRDLVASSASGAAAIEALAGRGMAAMVGEWQLANWLDNHPTYPGTGRLQYPSWNFRSVFAASFGPNYPLAPVAVSGSHAVTGTLRAGSGYHFRVTVPAGGSMTVKLGGVAGASRVNSAVEPRFAVVRLR